MDDFHRRALANARDRHEKQIRQSAERIAEHIGYVIARLDNGQVGSVGHYAAGIAADAHEIVTRLALLEGIGDAVGILETHD